MSIIQELKSKLLGEEQFGKSFSTMLNVSNYCENQFAKLSKPLIAHTVRSSVCVFCFWLTCMVYKQTLN